MPGSIASRAIPEQPTNTRRPLHNVEAEQALPGAILVNNAATAAAPSRTPTERLAQVINTAELHVAKQRNGPTGKITLRFDPDTTWFSSAARDQDVAADCRR